MRDKFRTNIRIVAPAALITLAIYIFSQSHRFVYDGATEVSFVTVIPYLLVIVTAVMGVNVLVVLTLGIVSAGIIGIAAGTMSPVDWSVAMGISRNIAHRFGIPPRRAASLLDTFSCFVQGIIPYGAQLLMAAGLASVSPVQIIPYLYYPFIMGCCAVLAIILQRPRYRD